MGDANVLVSVEHCSVCVYWESFDLPLEPSPWKPNGEIIEWNLFCYPSLSHMDANKVKTLQSQSSFQLHANAIRLRSHLSPSASPRLDKWKCIHPIAVIGEFGFHTNYVTRLLLNKLLACSACKFPSSLLLISCLLTFMLRTSYTCVWTLDVRDRDLCFQSVWRPLPYS